MASWNPPSSLLASGPSTTPTHQYVGTSTGMPQTKQLTGWRQSTTHQQIGCLKNPPEPLATPGHGPAHERVQDQEPQDPATQN